MAQQAAGATNPAMAAANGAGSGNDMTPIPGHGHHRANMLLAIALIGAMAAWLGMDYLQARQMHEEMLNARGQGTLSAMTAGIRSHRRLATWFRSNIEPVLEATASTPGILGLAILSASGELIASAGILPETLKPSLDPQWQSPGYTLWQRSLITSTFAQPDTAVGPGLGRLFRKDGPEEASPGNPEMFTEEEIEAILQTPLWFCAHLDAAEYHDAVRRDRKQFLASCLIAVGAILLGLFSIHLDQRRADLKSELNLSQEREKRLEELNRLAAGLAHETRNPINLIRGIAQSSLSQESGADLSHPSALKIIDEADRLVRQINSFLAYSKPLMPVLADVDFGAVLDSTVQLFKDEAQGKGIQLSAEVMPVRARADSGMLRQILVNLIANSVASCQAGNSILVRLAQSEDGQEVSFSVEDTGCGIAPEDLAEVTKPYFSRREGGTGLGLSIVERLAHSMGWRMNIQSKPGEGVRVHFEGIRISS